MQKINAIRFLLIFIYLFFTVACLGENCHPPIDSAKVQYIIGYGSLMNTKSKTRTDNEVGQNLPVMVTGLQRGWYMNVCDLVPGGLMTTFLGVIVKPNSVMNAVVYHADNSSDVYQFDEREKGYCRYQIAPQKIKFLSQSRINHAQYWVYLTPKKMFKIATKSCPIVQSYIDLFLTGCLNLQVKYHLPGFAKTCITTTHAWSQYWIDDRIFPRRPFIYQKNALSIDHLLLKTVPSQFKYRHIE